MLSQEVHEQQKTALMEATVQAVVKNGFENLTTRIIGGLSGVKEVYIYRYFENKEDLIAKTFTHADKQFLKLLFESLPVMECVGLDFEMRCRLLFQKCWDYILAHPDWLIFYIHYYYSSSFQKYSYGEHISRYSVLNEKMRAVCPPDADVTTMLHHLLDTLLGQVRKQITHPRDTEQAADEAFWLLFRVMNGIRGK